MGYRGQQERMMPFLLYYRMMEYVQADVHGSVHGCGVGESRASGQLAIQWLLRVDCLWRVRTQPSSCWCDEHGHDRLEHVLQGRASPCTPCVDAVGSCEICYSAEISAVNP